MTPLVSRRSWLAGLALAVALSLVEVGALAAGSGCVDITGCWPCGSWESYCNSHQGKLRGTIERCGCGYECTFGGTFLKVVPFRYKVPLRVTSVEDGAVHFSARKKIPLFGEFSCCGTATQCTFFARYKAAKDQGEFRMSR